MRIASELLEQIVAHARADAPNECCGLMAVQDGVAVEARAMENTAASPLRFEMDSMEQFRAMEEMGEERLGAIYHSHTRSAPVPSQTDITYAAYWPGVLWLIVGLHRGELDVRLWSIDGAKVEQLELIVE